MPTPVGERNGGVGTAVKRVADHAKALIGLEVELATVEVRRKVTALGVGAALLAAAAVFSLLALGFGFATVAAAFATFLPTWLSLLITFGILLALAGALAGAGLARIRSGTPPLPEQAIREAKLTQEAIRNGRT